ncbi:hypothetical protein GCM10011600_09120 [Pseudolysinimonas yzui]|uniref:Uncharacterized protein n=1 Tax=Pseudolysinimonas yzui TaxID=2708254 RepID=A0A8J3GPF4_9MICO|nr:hypothetical protein GCM10011600_09120 [Pseudolysinimonas yzui]
MPAEAERAVDEHCAGAFEGRCEQFEAALEHDRGVEGVVGRGRVRRVCHGDVGAGPSNLIPIRCDLALGK